MDLPLCSSLRIAWPTTPVESGQRPSVGASSSRGGGGESVMARRSPAATRSDTWFTAASPLKRRVTPSHWSAGPAAACNGGIIEPSSSTARARILSTRLVLCQVKSNRS